MEGTLATISLFAGNFAPRTWAYCAGQLVAIQSNTALFSLLGTTYGGDGRTTFALPDLRSRTAVGAGQGAGLSAYVPGEKIGTETNTLLLSNLPAHNHTAVLTAQMQVNVDNNDSPSPENTYPAGTSSAVYNSSAAPNQFMGALHTTASTGMNGQGLPMNNLQPFLGMNYIICVQGIFPYRN